MLLRLGAHAQFNEAIGTDKVQFGRSVQATVFDPGYVVAGKEEWDGITLGRGDASIVKTKSDGSVVWTQLYGGEGDEWFNSIREEASKGAAKLPFGYAALGTSETFSGTPDAYFLRTDENGTPLFSLIFGKEGKDFGYCLQNIKDYETGRAGYVWVGQTSSYPFFGGSDDIFVVKIDEVGNLVKATVMGGRGEDVGYWIEQTRDGGFILVGSTTSASCTRFRENKDIFVVRLDPKLNIVWNAIIGHEEKPTEDVAYSVVEDPTDGSFTLTGYTKSFGASDQGDAFLLNLSSVGGLNWMKTYGTTKIEQGHSIHLSHEKCGEVEYVVSGVSSAYSPKGDAYVFKTDRLGNLMWTFVYGTDEGTGLAAEITDSNENGYVFVGYTQASFSNYLDIYLVKTDINGKSGSDCQRELRQSEKPQFPCVTSSLQQVFVDDIKRVDTRVKRVDYRENRCDSYISLGADERQGGNAVEEIVVTPNPAKNSISLKSLTKNIKGGQMKIYNRQGGIVFEGPVSDDSLTLAVTSYPKNMYVIHIITPEGESVYGRFLKE